MVGLPVSRLDDLQRQQREIAEEIERERHRETTKELRDAFGRLASDDDLDVYDIVYRALCGWAGNGKARQAASVSEFAQRLTKAIVTRD